MTTNKHTATRTTTTGKTIEVTIERGTWDEKVSLDGWQTGSVKTHLVNRTAITIKDGNKVLVSGDKVRQLDARLDKNAPANSVAKIAGAYIGANAYELIISAIAEAEAAAPKTERQIEIEAAEAEQKAKAEAYENSPAGIADRKAWERHEQLMREMNRADSDY